MTTAITTPHLPDASNVGDLEDWGPLEEATGAEMHTWGVTLWEDGDASAGVWECTPGPSRWLLETHEVIHLVARPDDRHPGRRRAHRDRPPVTSRCSPRAGRAPGRSTRRLRKVYAIF